jgi:hypothetical protein
LRNEAFHRASLAWHALFKVFQVLSAIAAFDLLADGIEHIFSSLG